MERALAAVLTCGCLAFAVPAQAQVEPETRFVDMDDMLIDGEMLRPDGLLVGCGGRSGFSPLLRIERSFTEDVLLAAHELQ